MFELTNRLLIQRGQSDFSDAVRLLRLDAESHGGDSVDADAQDQEVLIIDGRQFPTQRLTPLLRALAAYLNEIEIGADLPVPYKVGRTRFLIHDRAAHENGTDMAYPVEVEIGGRQLFFEANWPRSVALFHVVKFLREAGLEATIPGTA